jgi:hypothetical protein
MSLSQVYQNTGTYVEKEMGINQFSIYASFETNMAFS